MKTEDHAWRELQRHAAAQLRPDFAQRVLRAANGPDAATWRQLQAQGAALLRPGFAERVLRAARSLPRMPSVLDQLAFGAATAAACLIAVVLMHARTNHLEEQRNLEGWQQLAAEVQDFDIAR
jgi:hypothetical protein